MKRVLAFAAAFALALPISFTMPTVAAADTAGDGNGGLTAACQSFLASAFGFSQGNCIAFFRGQSNANAMCHNFQSVDPTDFDATFSSFGACVTFFNTVFGKS